jgi:hypothetical protein
MSYRSSSPLVFAAAMLLIAGVGMVRGTPLRAQDATASPAVVQGSAAPAEATPSPAVSADAGPRIVPPFDRYQPSLPQRDRSETSAAVAGRGSHTIVLSTLALVLVVVIVVLLAVN